MQTTPLPNKEQPSEAYLNAYLNFLLSTNVDSDSDFPIWGFYLFDLNFDKIPELGILQHSGGSMGGYFTFYCFNGSEIVPVLNSKNEPTESSNYVQMLADIENKKVYLLKEMYLLRGNENGTYGYVSVINYQNGLPYVSGILRLEGNQKSDLEKHYSKSYFSEDDFLSDSELDGCLITQCYSGDEWNEITSKEYLRRKRELIPVDNSFVNLLDADTYILLYSSASELVDENGDYRNIMITEEKIETLFSKWLKYIG